MKEFKRLQIIYGIYNRGMTVFEPRLVDLTDVNDTTHPNYAQVVFDINHLVRDIEAHPDSILIFEVQVPAPRNATSRLRKTDGGPHTGYLMSSKRGTMTKTSKFEDYEPDELGPQMFQTLGWSVIDLFSFKHDLKKGTYKIPLYKPPTIINLDVRDLPHIERLPDTMVWTRIAFPKEDDLSEIRCDPSHYHTYYLPEIHNFAPKVEMYVKPERDPNYVCDGIHCFVHTVTGFAPERHIRVAICLQMGKDVVVQKDGGLCFYATRGIRPPRLDELNPEKPATPSSSRGRKTPKSILKKKGSLGTGQSVVTPEAPKKVPEDYEFEEGKIWNQDYYAMLWDEELNENLYAVFQ